VARIGEKRNACMVVVLKPEEQIPSGRYRRRWGCIRGKNRSREYSKGNKTVPGKVATTHTED